MNTKSNPNSNLTSIKVEIKPKLHFLLQLKTITFSTKTLKVQACFSHLEAKLDFVVKKKVVDMPLRKP